MNNASAATDVGAPVTMTDLADFKQEMMDALNAALETKLTVTPPPVSTSESKEEEEEEEPKSPTSFKLEVNLPSDTAAEDDGEKKTGEAKVTENPWTLAKRRGLSEKLGEIPAENFTVKKGSKTALLTFDTQEAKDKAKETLDVDYKVNDGSKELKKLLPRLKLDNIDSSLLEGDKDTVKAAIKASLLLFRTNKFQNICRITMMKVLRLFTLTRSANLQY